MKIYDCFLFNKELDLLKLRLQELYDYVDYFVLVESNKTFSGKSKKFIFENNKERFNKWKDKIIHIKVENSPALNRFGEKIQRRVDRFNNKNFPINGLVIHLGVGRWKIQKFQRNAIIRGLKKADDSDIILVSDLDEIPNPEKFSEMIELLKKENKVGFKQKMFYYYLNGYVNDRWVGTTATTFKNLKEKFKSESQNLRASIFDSKTIKKIFRLKELKLVKKGGWHFSYLGSSKEIMEKISTMSGTEAIKKLNWKIEEIEEIIKNNKFIHNRNEKINYVPVDDSFPEALRKNIKEYSHLIKNVRKRKK